jgi:hypothetical protein
MLWLTIRRRTSYASNQQSRVTLSDCLFERLKRTQFELNENIEGLSALGQEFQFQSLSQCMGAFKKEI